MKSLLILKCVKRTSYVFLLLLMFQCSVTAKQPTHDWQAPFFQDHELVGKIWDTHKNSWLTLKQYQAELLYYDYILLGEIHNHPDHHVLQAEVINSLVLSGVKPAVVMEMLSLQGWQEQPLQWNKADKLQELASMLNEGWPWELYAPILQSVVRHQLKLFAGNISSDELHRWSNEKSKEDDENLLSQYSYTKDNFELLKKNIIESHCGHANQDFVNFMSRAQMQRDKTMAELLVEKESPVVFIAGSGHVRDDYAVPMQLRNRFSQNSYLSVAYIAVQEGEEDPQAYLQNVPALYDILYFTPSHTDQDPCEQFRKQLENMQRHETLE